MLWFRVLSADINFYLLFNFKKSLEFSSPNYTVVRGGYIHKNNPQCNKKIYILDVFIRKWD